MKACTKCGEAKPVSGFYHNPITGRPRTQCRACLNAYHKEYRQRNGPATYLPEYHRNWHLQRKYGMSIEDFDDMQREHGGVCAICKRPPTTVLFVDHCHATGVVRGLLCKNCNLALGLLEDDTERMTSMIAYLMRVAPAGSQRPGMTPVAAA